MDQATNKLSWARQAVLALGLSLALLWPALLNGGPFWFPDTSTYVRSADAASAYVTGHRSEWSSRLELVSGAGATPDAEAARGSTEPEEQASQLRPTRPVLTGRSIYYGALLYFPMLLGGPWASVFLQALITSGLIIYCVGIVRKACPSLRNKHLAIGSAVLIAATPLPYYVSILMPDIYSGLTILVLATALSLGGHLSKMARALLVLAAGVMATFHTTNLLIALSIIAFALVILPKGRESLRPIVYGVVILSFAIAGSTAFSFAVKSSTGIEPVSPPFLTARLAANPVGASYIAETCINDREPYAVCRYRDRFPLNSDQFLWDTDPSIGVFGAGDSAEQTLLGSEDKRFYLSVLAHDPIGLTSTAFMDFWSQLGQFDLISFNGPFQAQAIKDQYPQNIADDILSSRAAQGEMPVDVTIALSILVSILSTLTIAIYALRLLRQRNEKFGEIARFVSLVVLAILANAAICGALSGPKARYQMRLIWVLPAVAMLASTQVRLRQVYSEAGSSSRRPVTNDTP